jgi:hypothetical protein
MVDTTPVAVCKDPVICIIKTATNMKAIETVYQYREQYKQGTSIMRGYTIQSCDKNIVNVTPSGTLTVHLRQTGS